MAIKVDIKEINIQSKIKISNGQNNKKKNY